MFQLPQLFKSYPNIQLVILNLVGTSSVRIAQLRPRWNP